MSERRGGQQELASESNQSELVALTLFAMLEAGRQPSAWELVAEVEAKVGPKARWILLTVLEHLSNDVERLRSWREYSSSLRTSDDLVSALRGEGAPGKEIASAIDSLLQQSTAYRGSLEFQDMVSFMALFRDYAPFNNLLVRVQNPTCSFYATESDWANRFSRTLREDARPMLILAPMHPVMLVYDVDQTEGKKLPKEAIEFARFDGEWRSESLARLVENAETHDRIRVNFKPLSSTSAGFATRAAGEGGWKMRIAIHDELNEPSRFGVLCHELAHIYLGHLGTDNDHWWPSRKELSHQTVEIEAEAVAFIVSARFGLQGASARYVSRHINEAPIPASVSLDLIAKVASRLQKMASGTLRPRHSQQQSQGE